MQIKYIAIWAALLLFVSHGLNTGVSHSVDITEVKPGVPVALRIPDTDLDLSGYASPGALVTILDGTTVIGTTTADSNGFYQASFVSQTPGVHIIHVYYDDSDGRVSSSTTDLIALAVKTLTAYEVNPSPTVTSSPTSVYEGEVVQFEGQAKPGSTVEILLDNNLTVTTQADLNGNWSVDLPTSNFFIGFHSYTVKSSAFGYNSETSQKYQFQVQKNPEAPPTPEQPITPIVVPVDEDLVTVITDPGDSYVSSGRDLIITGNGPINTQIEVYVDDQLIGSVFTNALGIWTIKIYLEKDQQVVRTRACDDSGCGPFSENTRYFFNGGLGQCDIDLWLDTYRFNRQTISAGVDININTLNTGNIYDVVVDWGDITVNHQTQQDPTLRLHHNYQGVGNYTGLVTVEKNDTCIRTVYFTVRVVDSSSRDWLYIILGVLFGMTVIVRYVYSRHNHTV